MNKQLEDFSRRLDSHRSDPDYPMVTRLVTFLRIMEPHLSFEIRETTKESDCVLEVAHHTSKQRILQLVIEGPDRTPRLRVRVEPNKWNWDGKSGPCATEVFESVVGSTIKKTGCELNEWLREDSERNVARLMGWVASRAIP